MRARDLSVTTGVFIPSINDAITGVAWVRIGQVTLRGEGDTVGIGVTAILPHPHS